MREIARKVRKKHTGPVHPPNFPPPGKHRATTLYNHTYLPKPYSLACKCMDEKPVEVDTERTAIAISGVDWERGGGKRQGC